MPTKGPPKKCRSEGQACDDEEIQQVMVRDYLMWKQEAIKFIEAKSMVALFKSKESQQLMVAMLEYWEESKPEVSDEHKHKKEWPPHPTGLNKKSWMFKSTLQWIQDEKLWDEYLAAKGSVDAILNLDNSVLERSIGVFSPKVNTPRQQGNWKFDLVLTEFPAPEVTEGIQAFIACKCNGDKFCLEFKRPRPQPQTEQEMWTWLKRPTETIGRSQASALCPGQQATASARADTTASQPTAALRYSSQPSEHFGEQG